MPGQAGWDTGSWGMEGDVVDAGASADIDNLHTTAAPMSEMGTAGMAGGSGLAADASMGALPSDMDSAMFSGESSPTDMGAAGNIPAGNLYLSLPPSHIDFFPM